MLGPRPFDSTTQWRDTEMWSIGMTAGTAALAGQVRAIDVARTSPASWTTETPVDQGVALKSPAIIAGRACRNQRRRMGRQHFISVHVGLRL